MKKVATNKRAKHDFEILQEIEAGIQLTGAEVKSIKAGNVSLKGAHAAFTATGPVLLNMYVNPYKPAADPSYDPERTRPLLLHKREVQHLRGKVQEQGLTIVPISVYIKKNLIKILLGLARGKKQHDKREAIKKRDTDRQTRRLLKGI